MFLKQLIEKRNAEINELRAKIKASDNADEVRALGVEIEKKQAEIREAEAELAKAEAAEKESNDEANKNNEDDKNNEDAKADEARTQLNPLATFGMNKTTETRETEDLGPTGKMEYRTAFKNYVQRGETSEILTKYSKRADAVGTSGDLGVLIPMTVIQKVITDVEKVRGVLYDKVKKTNVPGGVKYPIGAFSATFHRITETGNDAAPTDRQKGGSITGYVEFSYNMGEIRIAQTILQTILAVPAFETKLAEVIAKAYVAAMDKEIMTGDPANHECVGILTEAAKSNSRIPAANIIEFTEADMADWTAWQKKLFAVIPLSMRSLRPEFAMTANTYEANIKTLKDNNNRPLYAETFNPVDGNETATFKGRPVAFVENDVLKDFDDAENGEYFGMYWVPEEAYAINTNFEFAVQRYFDNEKLQWVDRALVINDGKVLDPKYLYLLKKKATPVSA